MRSIIIVLLLSILAACAPATPLVTASASLTPSLTLQPTRTPYPSRTPTPSFTPFPTLTPSLTSTSQLPLVEHEWQPERVLLSLETTPGDGGFAPPDPPRFILYADGSMFITEFLETEFSYTERLLTRKIERREICQNLNTLDQIGFLDYNPSDYQFIGGRPNVQGGGGVYIRVNAWKSHSNIYHELGIYLDEEITGEIIKNRTDNNDRSGFPVISPALRAAYTFLTEYSVQGFEVYQPERLAVWIRPIDTENFQGNEEKEWTLMEPSLADMFAKINYDSNEFSNPYLVLIGKEAKTVYKFLGESYSEDYYYEVNGLGEKIYYSLYARPVLPYELPGDYQSQIPAPGSTKPDFKLTCYPSDGILPIPTPTIP